MLSIITAYNSFSMLGWISSPTLVCLHSLIKFYLKRESLDVYYEGNIDPTTIFHNNSKTYYINRFSKKNSSLLWRNSNVDTILFVEKLMPSLLIHGPRGRVVLVTNNISIATNFWTKYRIIDAIILNKNDSEHINAYTWFPYNPEECNQTLKLHLLDTCSEKQTWSYQLYPNKLPKKFQRCQINYAMTPDVLNIYIEKNGSFGGRDYLFMKTVAEHFDFSLHINLLGDFYNTISTVTPGGAMEAIHNGSADISFSNLYLDPWHYHWSEPLPTYRASTLIWILPKARRQPMISGIYSGLSTQIWILILTTNIAMICMIWQISIIKEVNYSFIHVIEIILNIPPSQGSSSRLIRLLLMLFQIYCLHIVWFYQSTLLGNLFRHPMQRQLEDIYEALEAGIKPEMKKWMLPTFPQNSTLMPKLVNAGLKFKDPFDFSHVVEYKNISVLSLQDDGTVSLSAKYPGRAMSKIVYVQRKPFYQRLVCPFGRRGSPLTDLISKKARHLVESGVYNYWTGFMPDYSQVEEPKEQNKPLHLELLQGAFFLYIIFAFIATLILFFELAKYRFPFRIKLGGKWNNLRKKKRTYFIRLIRSTDKISNNFK